MENEKREEKEKKQYRKLSKNVSNAHASNVDEK